MSSEPPAAGARGAVETSEPSAAQRSFARTVAESKATIPHVVFEEPLDAPPGRARLVQACALALREVPLLNGAYRDGRFERYGRVNIAVGIETDGTTLFPVVHDADELGAEEIGRRLAELEESARAGALTAPAFAGATFTLTDLSERVARFVPVIGHGQAATLGCGRLALTLACDNRIVQAGEGAEFLAAVVARVRD